MKKVILIIFLSLTFEVYALGPTTQRSVNYFESLNDELLWFDASEGQLPQSDTRLIFSRIYKEVTKKINHMLIEDEFQNPEWITRLTLKFGSLYRDALECSLSNACPVSPAWIKALKINKQNKLDPSIQVLFSISAHIIRDLPLAIAESDTDFLNPTQYEDFQKIAMVFNIVLPNAFNIVRDYQICRINRVDEKMINTTLKALMNLTRNKAWNYAHKLSLVENQKKENALLQEIENRTAELDRLIRHYAFLPEKVICL